MVAKSVGNEGGIPTIALDSNAMKGSLVGESERAIREALKVISAVTNDRALWVATCNSIGILPPELRRRFAFGTFFFDLPDAEERRAIWTHYIQTFFGKRATIPTDVPDEGWTGAEIRTCCLLAYRLKVGLVEASEYIVPVCQSARSQIEELRKMASGRFISASHKGPYRLKKESTGRAVAL